jgi:hypothetical protein
MRRAVIRRNRMTELAMLTGGVFIGVVIGLIVVALLCGAGAGRMSDERDERE